MPGSQGAAERAVKAGDRTPVPTPAGTVLLEFESVEAARNWYRSAEYQGLAGRRHAAADSNAVIVAGFEMPTG